MNLLVTQHAPTAIDKTIRLVIVLFTGIFFYMLVSKLWIMESNFRSIGERPWPIFLTLVPFVIAPFAVFYFWKKKSTGWHLLAAFFIFAIVEACWILLDKMIFSLPGEDRSTVFYRPAPLAYMIQLFLVVGMLYVISKRRIRNVYQVNMTRMYVTIAAAAYLSAFIMALFS